ncbi:radical SAM protein [Mucisphaera sp.]|uniref:radical SAM protein n=1 Tax=Mucisphaera sp. TaxID=2913024 RepID=UPI003D0EEB2C
MSVSGSALDRVFSHHPRQWRQFRLVYPVVSRRSGGLSIGVNLTPDGVCNFDCTYCSVDREKVADQPPADLDELQAELSVMFALVQSGDIWTDPDFADVPESHRVLRDLAFSGDGEPTSSPLFPAAVDLVMTLVEQMGLDLPHIVVITNGSLLHRVAVKAALARLGGRGEIWAKLDAGSNGYYRQVDRSAVPMERLIENLVTCSRDHPIVVQTMLLRDSTGPMPDHEFLVYLGRLQSVLDRGGRLREVQLYTVARDCREPDVEPVSEQVLNARAEQLRGVLPGLKVSIHPGTA